MHEAFTSTENIGQAEWHGELDQQLYQPSLSSVCLSFQLASIAAQPLLTYTLRPSESSVYRRIIPALERAEPGPVITFLFLQKRSGKAQRKVGLDADVRWKRRLTRALKVPRPVRAVSARRGQYMAIVAAIFKVELTASKHTVKEKAGGESLNSTTSADPPFSLRDNRLVSTHKPVASAR